MLIVGSFTAGYHAQNWWANRGFSHAIIDSEKSKVVGGFYDACIQKALPVGGYGKLGVCKVSGSLDKYHTFYMILYDSTGQIQLMDYDYSIRNNQGVTESVKGYKHTPEWYKTAASIQGKWLWENFDRPIPLGNNFFYLLEESEASSSLF